ncbi:MAG: hypothetical protein DRQ40_10775 [Gammaproteobacteria bacterium]|nr:MAG: hypothetical protein DRQ40_10775 [Gammaproteobacteria bacterium]
MPKLMEQGLSDSSSMQGDIMSMVKDEYKTGYTPRKADTSLEQLTQYRDRILASGGDTTDVDKAIGKATTSGSLVNIDMGENALTPGWMSDEVKASQGIPQSQAIWIDGKGVPKIINKNDVGKDKAAIALDQMEGATRNLNELLNEYDPNTLTEFATSLVDLPPAVANVIRTDTARAVNSEKKAWAEMVLRDATGAVINPSEYKDYDAMYMPQPGDKLQDWERKAKKRHEKENAYRVRIGVPEAEYVSPYAEQLEAEKNKDKSPSSLDYNNMSDEEFDARYQKMLDEKKRLGIK